jgi:lipopolysaccharide transport system ATP-binding protein
MADDIAIRVENLSKRYRIGAKEEVHDTLAGMLSDWVKRPAHNLRRLRDLTRFNENGQGPEDIIWALKNVSFEVKRGEVVGIIGRNGAGKSTLLKILSRITHPTRGRVELNELSGRENIYLNGTILGMRKLEIDRKFDEIVNFSGVEKFIDTPVKRYSSGMRVRLAFSVAAHLEPEILLIDEVLAVGDVEFQRKCLGKMELVAGAGRTILFVSHNMAAIMGLCPRTMLLNKGQVLEDGATTAVVQSYLKEGIVKEDVDLTDHPNRRDKSIPMMTRLQLLKSGELTSIFKTDEEFSFEVHCLTDNLQLRRLSLGFLITDSLGHTVFGANMYQYDQLISKPESGYVISLRIDALPLVQGTYSLSLFLGDGGRDIDIIMHAISFDVVWSQELKLAFPPLASWGTTYIPLCWAYRAN